MRWTKIGKAVEGRFLLRTDGCSCCTTETYYPADTDWSEVDVTPGEVNDLEKSLNEQLELVKQLRQRMEQDGPNAPTLEKKP